MKYDECQSRVKALGTRGGTPNQVRLGRWDRKSYQWEINPNPKEEQDPARQRGLGRSVQQRKQLTKGQLA